jgi:ankyrin repeat protein
MDAVAAGQPDAVRLLLAARADVNARSKAGRTALIEAAEQGQLEAARLLIAAGADLNTYQRGWGTALKTAERTGHNDIAEMLRKAGAQSSGSSVGDTVCVRPWSGDGYCGTVEAIDKNNYTIRVTQIVGCKDGCPAKEECSAGRPVGGSGGIAVGDEVKTVSWCLTHTGVKP